MHEVIYYTVEDGDGQILQKADTLRDALIWVKNHRTRGRRYICGFQQLRDADGDVMDEIPVYEKRVA